MDQVYDIRLASKGAYGPPGGGGPEQGLPAAVPGRRAGGIHRGGSWATVEEHFAFRGGCNMTSANKHLRHEVYLSIYLPIYLSIYLAIYKQSI